MNHAHPRTFPRPPLTRQVKSICLTDDDSLERYQDLFEGPTSTELQAQFQEIVGDSFDTIDPSMQALFDGANQNVNTAAQDICSDLGRGSLSLDKAILACVFHHVESFCPSAEDDENIPTFLKELEWELPKVRTPVQTLVPSHSLTNLVLTTTLLLIGRWYSTGRRRRHHHHP